MTAEKPAVSGSGAYKTSAAEEQRLAAWAAISTRSEFTASDVAALIGASEEWGRKVVREWRNAGQLETVRQDGQTVIWRARELGTSQKETAFARERRRPEFAMWRTMRDLRRFRADEVHLTANTEQTPMSVADVQKYCSTLAEAGYLKVAVKGRIGQRLPVYAMIGRPGPFPPRVMRVPAVYDPNEGAFKVLEKRVRT